MSDPNNFLRRVSAALDAQQATKLPWLQALDGVDAIRDGDEERAKAIFQPRGVLGQLTLEQAVNNREPPNMLDFQRIKTGWPF